MQYAPINISPHCKTYTKLLHNVCNDTQWHVKTQGSPIADFNALPYTIGKPNHPPKYTLFLWDVLFLVSVYLYSILQMVHSWAIFFKVYGSKPYPGLHTMRPKNTRIAGVAGIGWDWLGVHPQMAPAGQVGWPRPMTPNGEHWVWPPCLVTFEAGTSFYWLINSRRFRLYSFIMVFTAIDQSITPRGKPQIMAMIFPWFSPHSPTPLIASERWPRALLGPRSVLGLSWSHVLEHIWCVLLIGGRDVINHQI